MNRIMDGGLETFKIIKFFITNVSHFFLNLIKTRLKMKKEVIFLKCVRRRHAIKKF